MLNLFTTPAADEELCLAAGQTHAARLPRATRVSVHEGLVWLTLEQGGADIWLHAGQHIELPAGGLMVLEAARQCARVVVQPSPGAGVASIMRRLPQGLIRWS